MLYCRFAMERLLPTVLAANAAAVLGCSSFLPRFKCHLHVCMSLCLHSKYRLILWSRVNSERSAEGRNFYCRYDSCPTFAGARCLVVPSDRG